MPQNRLLNVQTYNKVRVVICKIVDVIDPVNMLLKRLLRAAASW
jgi:hypothetical protein